MPNRTLPLPSLRSLLCALALLSLSSQGLQAHRVMSDTLFNQRDGQGRRQGFWRRLHSNGQVAYRAEFRDGAPVGLMRRYAPSGQLEVEIRHMPDGHTAYATYYDSRGAKSVPRGKFYDRAKDSVWSYYAGGLLVRQESWRRGVKHGEFTLYSDQGLPARREHWREGRLDGAQDEYYGNGKLRMRWLMRNDTAHGRVFTLFPNGMPRLVGLYRDGLRDSTWTLYNSLGKEEMRLVYRAGQLMDQDSIARAQAATLEQIFSNAGRIPEPSESFPARY